MTKCFVFGVVCC